MLEILKRVQREIQIPLGVHFHNDAGVAVASSIMAAQTGATQLQGTFNGYGERCGNANLSSIIPTLVLKLGYESNTKNNLNLLAETSRFISELTNLHHDEPQPLLSEPVPLLIKPGCILMRF